MCWPNTRRTKSRAAFMWNSVETKCGTAHTVSKNIGSSGIPNFFETDTLGKQRHYVEPSPLRPQNLKKLNASVNVF